MSRRLARAYVFFALTGCAGGSVVVPQGDDDTGTGEPPVDREPPIFAGVIDAVATDETHVTLAWPPGRDDTSPVAALRYRVYVGPGGGPIDFATPVLTTAAGATQATVGGLSTAVTVSFAVRAIDEAGNEDGNVDWLEATPADLTPPTFGGVATVAPPPGDDGALELSWAAAVDNVSAAADISYEIFVADTSGAQGAAPTQVTLAGETSATVDGLQEARVYYVVVRARDAAGNRDDNGVERNARTLDVTGPLFAGLEAATAAGTAVRLSWTAAEDNLDPPERLRYRVWADVGAVDFAAAPTSTTPPGATAQSLIALTAGETYELAVRAVDEAGNDDGNQTVLRVTLAASGDTTAPQFLGVGTAEAAGGTAVEVAWAAADDDQSPPEAIVYDIFVTPAGEAPAYGAPALTSSPGALGATVTGLTPDTAYEVRVRARDEAGNTDGNTVAIAVRSAIDASPPDFDGIGGATPLSVSSIEVTWEPAADDQTPASAMSYEVFVATAPGAFDLTAPSNVVSGGATLAVVTGLVPGTTYWLRVRARDQAGNRDSNLAQLSAATLPDVTAPTFGGIRQLVGTGATSLLAQWSAASDDVTPASSVRYEVHVAVSSGGQSFTQPYFTTAPGATSAAVVGLAPDTIHYVVVRARDSAGVVDDNTEERGAPTLADVTPPSFGGARAVRALGTTSLEVSWNAALDDVTVRASLLYRVCWSEIAGACLANFTEMGAVTGGTSLVLSGLPPDASYGIVVRAQDGAGNTDGNAVERFGSTQIDDLPPRFDGVAAATARGDTALEVSWAPAGDDTDDAAAITYEIYVATAPGAQDLGTPYATSAAGATELVIGGLVPDTLYYLLVRAVDTSGNRDPNRVEAAAATDPDTFAPMFAGTDDVSLPSETTLYVRWLEAIDDATPTGELTYQLCWSDDPQRCLGDDFTAMLTTAAGALDETLTGLSPDTTYYVVVRATDAHGNRDANDVARPGTTLPDVVPPDFGGATAVTDATVTSLTVLWDPGNDNVTADADLRYDLCYDTTAGACSTSFEARESVVGAASWVLTGLSPDKSYYVLVRAVDEAGNYDDNTNVLIGQTLIDNQAPSFGGVDTAVSEAVAQMTLTWIAAADNATPPSQIFYPIYVHPPGAAPPASWPNGATVHATAPAGQTAITLSGFIPSQSYWVAVRATDGSGNTDANSTRRQVAIMADTMPPNFAGASGASATSATTVTVTWTKGTDNYSPQTALQYQLCWSTTPGACTGTGFSAMSTVGDVASAGLAGLTPTTTYYVVVRCRDQFNNRDTNDNEVAVATINDAIAPTFSGASSISDATGSSLRVNWAAATDNVTSAGNMRYDVCYDTVAANCTGSNFNSNFDATVTGLTNTVIGSLTSGVTYNFVVRARDQAGNRDNNDIVRNGTTLDIVAPTAGAASSVSNAACSSLRVNFSQASDNVTAQGSLLYRICWSTSPTGCTSSFAVNATVVGSPLNYTATSLSPFTTYYFVVRAEDAVGNRSTNTTVQSGATTAGTVSVGTINRSSSCGTVAASWSGSATCYASNQIQYQWCALTSSSSAGCSWSPWTTNQVSTNFTGLSSGTTYWVHVQARTPGGGATSSVATSASIATPVGFSTVNPLIGTTSVCTGCHGIDEGWTRAELVNQDAAWCGGSTVRVTPGNAAISELMIRLDSTTPGATTCGGAMPDGGPQMSLANRNIVRAWINAGACN